MPSSRLTDDPPAPLWSSTAPAGAAHSAAPASPSTPRRPPCARRSDRAPRPLPASTREGRWDVSEERRETATTPSWSQLSPEREGLQDDLVRRFVEASRRAEIIALVNSASSADELGFAVCDELSEAFEAEKAFVIAARGDGSPPTLVAGAGLSERERERILHDPLTVGSLAGDGVRSRVGEGLAGVDARSLALSPGGDDTDRVLVGVARSYERAFDPAER